MLPPPAVNEREKRIGCTDGGCHGQYGAHEVADEIEHSVDLLLAVLSQLRFVLDSYMQLRIAVDRIDELVKTCRGLQHDVDVAVTAAPEGGENRVRIRVHEAAP